MAAIGRVEVLKDGAAATYGSDAIGGVVNFITKSNFEGLEISGSYRSIDGSDGDFTSSLVYGWQGDRSNFLFTAGWQHRSELPMTEKDWALRPYLDNPEGGWSAAGNPSTFIALATGQRFRDDQCAPLGGFAGFSGATPVCYWNYTQFDNLVEKEDRWQIYSEFNIDFTDTTRLHLEGFYSATDVPEWKTSPSYALLGAPTATTNPFVPGQYYIPGNNPGLQAYMAAHPGAGGIPGYTSTGVQSPVTAANLAAGVLVVASRPYALGGNPMFDYGSSRGSRNYKAYRLGGDLSGEWENGINWTFSLFYGQETGTRTGYDTVISRYQLALRGLGGANCNGIVAGNPGSTCEWFNPFSSAVPGNAITGQGGGTFNPALSNSEALTRWFFQKLETEQETGLWVAEALFSGKLFEMGGGDAQWALGAQYRQATFSSSYNDFSNRAINPCIDTPVNGSTTCAAPQGPFTFLGVGSEASLKQEVNSFFGEIVLPFSDNFNATIAARYESYGGEVGSTFDPKISVRWQVIDSFALRGSLGTTFRAPPSVSLTNNFVTSLQSIVGTFRAVDIFGNPNLEPETATTYSIGAIFQAGGFKATLDYWNFDFQDPITTDPVSGIVNQVFPGGVPNCASPLAARFTFSGGVCGPATTVQRLRTNTVNGAGVKTSGVDLIADYTFNDFAGGRLTIGTTATYVIEYVTEETEVEGIVVAPSFDAVGLLNYQTTAYPLPQKKGSLFFEYSNGAHNLRWTIRYIDGYTDQRTAPFLATSYFTDNVVRTNIAAPITAGKQVDSFTTMDLTYRVFLPFDSTLAVSVENIFDEDPPFARLDLNYDPFTASGLGRNWKVSLTKKF